jgi:hypothetical protein
MWTWCYHGSCKLVTLELHNSCFYIVVTLLHVYMVSHIVGCICYNSCDLSNNTQTCKNIHVYIVSHIVSCICCVHATCTIAFTLVEICQVVVNFEWSMQFKTPFARLVANHPIFSKCECQLDEIELCFLTCQQLGQLH